MSDDNATQDLPDQPTAEEVSLEATEDRDDGDLDVTQSTESDHVALAHSVGEQRCCTESAECHSVSPPQDVHVMDEKLRPIQAHLEYLLNKADEYQAHLIQRRDRLQIEGLCRVVPTFLKSCHPFFSYLEHTARSYLPHRPLLPGYIRTQLLHFSQQLCSRLEELILTYASYNFLTLEETNPLSYFLCYEEVRREEDGSGEEEESLSEGERGEEEEEGERRERRSEVKMWSIGQWVQTHPNPETDDIYEWIPCGIPRAHYQQLFHLGLTEPSVCSATDCLLGALLSYDSQ
ncbi:UPF0575 protein C19orf67 homolog isoform X2 [Alosa sapidissima]|uniref:UPF0575 protein C19orf67 homolog isoform X2 n=1 Tax=Alosa sapidissima TaxID=34773 RepID=UPI001C0A160C|nr:UPF0575 protein C19orf67 homolog isoform X2 [Alosa sapidissima]